MKNSIYLIIETFFGIVLYKSEAASWFRIFEMFHFKSFHMYGIIGVAVITGIVIVYFIKKTKLKNIEGTPIRIEAKSRGWKNYLYGGIIFGLGWALAGACPGPMFVLAGAGFWPILIVIFGGLLGTFVYGLIKDKLPH